MRISEFGQQEWLLVILGSVILLIAIMVGITMYQDSEKYVPYEGYVENTVSDLTEINSNISFVDGLSKGDYFKPDQNQYLFYNGFLFH